MLVGDRQRQAQARRVRMQHAQLQVSDSLRLRAADTGRIQRLHQLEDALHLVGIGGDFGQQRRGDVVRSSR